jgi:hypothetical protein
MCRAEGGKGAILPHMKKIIMGIVCATRLLSVYGDENKGRLENGLIAWQWDTSSGQLASTLIDKSGGSRLEINSECFQMVLQDGRTLKASEFTLAGTPRTESLPAEPASPIAARHFAGRQMALEFSDAPDHLSASWKASVREGSSYMRQELTLRASGGDVGIKEIVLFEQKLAGAKTMGTVSGSPVVAGTVFCGYEHPMSQNTVEGDDVVRCSLARNAVLKDGETLKQRLVLGVMPSGQIRRGFLAYIERERAHPYRPFLHYNSWYDIAWDNRKFNEAESLNAIKQFGRHLVRERGVRMDSFLFDDGWDDNKTLWKFHVGFPNGFTPLKAAAAKYHAGIGVWLSPFGGYADAREQRLKYGSQLGYETNASGFSLAGPKYYQLFRQICLEMIQKYGVNQFKFDGLAAGARASRAGLTRDGDAMLQLLADLRAAEPNLYINQTTGTWPSPFWLLEADSTWRGGADHDFQGQGSWCQQWITYRDAHVYQNVVQAAPLYPLNALMLHGVLYATNAFHLAAMSDEDFADQARTFFGSGTQLQELYITPGLMNRRKWDVLAEAAKWSRRNADVLVDTHWIGGDPGKGEVYGWASWAPRKGILVLRNPSDKPAAFEADLATLFDVPPGSAEVFQLKSPWKNAGDLAPLKIAARQPHTFHLRPFEVMVREAKPLAGGGHPATRVPGA